MITKKDRVDLGVIACDQPGFFKMLDSGGDGEIRTRGGKALTDFESAPL